MRRKVVDENKLVKKYYIQKKWYSDLLGLSIVYGTVGKKTFTVVRRENIVEGTDDIRIELDLSGLVLFDEFEDASKKFLSRCKELRENIVDDLKLMDAGISFVTELSKQVEEEAKQ